MTIETQAEFLGMQEVGAIVANCLEMMKAATRPGMTTLELDLLAKRFLDKDGAISAPKSSYGFPGYTCISVEHAAAHGIPNDYRIREGDLLNIDVSAHKNGFYADNGESFVVGRGSRVKRRLTSVVRKALMAAINEARAGRKISRVGEAVQNVARQSGLSVVRNLGGHGVGRSLHEQPQFIASYFDPRDQRVFQDNQVVAIEPFLSDGAQEVKEALDGWTLYHRRFYSAQKEHTVMIRKGRAHIFTEPTKSFGGHS